MGSVFDYLFTGVCATLLQLLVILGPGLVIAFVMHHFSTFVGRRASSTFGHRTWMWTGAPGTVIHELGHALFCVVFRHKITEMKLFSPDPANGTLGYVAHSHDPSSRYQKVGNFFIGTGPIWLGTIVVFMLARLMLGIEFTEALDSIMNAHTPETVEVSLIDSAFSAISSVGGMFYDLLSFESLTSWSFYLFVYLLFTIGNGITLSPPDIKHSLEGFVALVISLLLLNWCFMWLGDITSDFSFFVERCSVYFYTVMAIVLFINIIISFSVITIGTCARKLIPFA